MTEISYLTKLLNPDNFLSWEKSYINNLLKLASAFLVPDDKNGFVPFFYDKSDFIFSYNLENKLSFHEQLAFCLKKENTIYELVFPAISPNCNSNKINNSSISLTTYENNKCETELYPLEKIHSFLYYLYKQHELIPSFCFYQLDFITPLNFLPNDLKILLPDMIETITDTLAIAKSTKKALKEKIENKIENEDESTEKVIFDFLINLKKKPLIDITIKKQFNNIKESILLNIQKPINKVFIYTINPEVYKILMQDLISFYDYQNKLIETKILETQYNSDYEKVIGYIYEKNLNRNIFPKKNNNN